MFFIMGIDPRQKELNYNEMIICDACGSYGRYRVWVSYMCFSLFFIPLIKWGREYYVQSTCCSTTYKLDPEIGKMIANGDDIKIRPEHLTKISSGKAHTYTGQHEKNCPYCGYTTSEDFQYCPKCGRPF